MLPDKIEGFRLSPQQRRLWLLQRAEPGGAYEARGAILIEGPLDRRVLREAVADVVRRHDILRTGCRSLPGMSLPLQVVLDGAVCWTEDRELGALDAAGRRAAAQALLNGGGEPLGLDAGPVLQLSLGAAGPLRHLLALRMPALCADGATLELLVREISRAYAVRSGESRPSVEPVQYADVATWLNELLEGEENEAERSYWKGLDGAALRVLRLPEERPSPPAARRDCPPVIRELAAPLLARIEARARELGVALPTFLLAGWHTLLARLVGRQEVIVGTGCSGRTYEELEGALGPLARYLPVRCRFEDGLTFRDVLDRVHEVAGEAPQWQEYFSLERLNGSADGPPVYFPFGFDFEEPGERHEAAGVGFRLWRRGVRYDRFDLRLVCRRTDADETASAAEPPGGLVMELHYDAGRYGARDVRRRAGQLERLLESAAREPDTAVDVLDILGEPERHELVVAANRTAAAYPAAACFHELFEQRAGLVGEGAVALRADGRELSYLELDRRANRLARQLRSRGVGPDVIVGLFFERSVELVVALLGTLKAGGAYLPLDPTHPHERLAFMIEDAGVGVVLTAEHLEDRLPARTVTIVRVQPGADPGEDDASPRSGVTPDHLAYVIYTSGSTGQPKGAMIPHRGLVNYLSWCTQAYRLDEGAGVPVHSPIGFDLTVTSLLAPLLVGQTVELLPERPPVELLEQALRERGGFSLIKLTPSHLALLASRLSPAEARRAARALIVGGEALRPEHLAFWREHAPHTRLINEYGPTETVVGCCVHDATAQADDGGGAVPIGRPIANTQLYVLDRELQPVPHGVPGELYVGGAGVARGYLGRPGLTAERFVPDPFAGEPGMRLYRTGDRCSWRADGLLEYLGRTDFQVKLHGYRIEPAEIEAVLEGQPEVREAAVILREDRPGVPRLVAYVVAGAGHEPSVADLRRRLQQQLPDHMVPAAIILLGALPLTVNGKLDRAALPQPDSARPELERPFLAPRTPVEEDLARIWREVLGVDRVGVRDNFFELGGDSILSIQVVSRASEIGLRLTPQQLFQHQTIAELAAVAGRAVAVDAEQGPVTGAVPLTPIQRWLVERQLESPHHFNQAVELELGEKLDPARLARAVEALLAHHDALRSRFEREPDGSWRPWIDEVQEGGQGLFRAVDLGALGAPARAAAAASQAAALQESFDLAAGPLVRVALFTGGDAERLLLVVHHLVVDGVSWRILLEDLLAGYRQLGAGVPPRLPPKTTSFRSWAVRLQQLATSATVADERETWREIVTAAGRSLPRDFARGDNTVASSETVEVALSEEATRALIRDIPTAYRTRIDEVLLTALAQALCRWTGEPAVVVDVEGHGREDVFADVDLSRTVGWFTTLYPVRLTPGGEDDPGAALKSVKERWRAVPGKGLGYGLLRFLRGETELASPAEVVFNYLGRGDVAVPDAVPFRLVAGGGPPHAPAQRRSHALEVSAGVDGGRLRMLWSYSRHLHERSTIERVAGDCSEALGRLIDHGLRPEAGGCTPSDFPLAALDQATLDRVVGAGRTVEDLYPLAPLQSGLLFHSLYAPDSGIYLEQIACTIEGELDPRAFREAWRAVVEHHPVLRTAFVWEGLGEPLQVVQRTVELPWEEEDWRGLESAARAERLGALLDEAARRGMDLSRAPLMRWSLIRIGDRAWRFVWSHHHVLLDGWSVSLVLKEVLLGYEARIRGHELPPAPPRSFRDYIAWLRRQDESRTESFWRDALRGFTTPTPLVIDRPLAAEAASAPPRHGERRRVLADQTAVRLARVAREHQLTLNTLVQGAWALVLSRYSGADDVLFGATVSGRSAPLAGIEAMLGLFINTLPVRVRVDDRASLLDWLRELQEQQATLRQHEASSLVQVQGWSEVPRGRPLFDSLLVFENYPIDRSLERREGGLSIRDVRYQERTNYPLTLIAVPDDGLELRLLYDARRFEDGAIDRMLGHLQTVLQGFADHTASAVGAIGLLDERECRLVLDSWSATRSAPPADVCLHRLVERQAQLQPAATAVEHDGLRLTYGELDDRAERLAARLRELGVGPEVPVGLCVARTPRLVVGLLGILKAGGAYVPLDPAYPAERLAFILADTAAPVVLAETAVLDRLPPSGARVVCLDREAFDAPAAPSPAARREAVADNLAYVIYTSGSTGRPKGVAISHRSAVELVRWAEGVFTAEELAGVLASTSICFDLSVFEIFVPLACGGRVVLAENALQLPSLPAAAGVTLVNTVPSAAEELLRAGGIPASVLTLNLAGEPLSTDLVRRIHAQGVRRVLDLYGPSEDTTYSTWAVRHAEGPQTIGRPITNTRAYILDPRLAPVPPGVPGELVLGGAGLARGYLNRADITAERFVPDPFGDPGGRLYRTGDRCRWLEDGSIEFLGRTDRQVKLRGFRIELDEIEAALGRLAPVQEAVVLVREDRPADRRLVAYVVTRAETRVDAEELSRQLHRELPDFMVPGAFVFLDALPLLPNGKIDRRALPAPDGARLRLDRDYVAPRTPLERQLAALWSEVLGVERVGIHDGFFQLGGHSLLATRLTSRLREELQVELPLRDVFEAHTVARLAAVVEQAGRVPAGPPIVPRERREEIPLSFAQERQWVLTQLVPDSAFYNLHAAVRIRGALDADALERSFAEIIRRHEVLRTTFPTVAGRPTPTVGGGDPFRLRHVDLTDTPAEQREAESLRHARQEVQRPFDLARGPLLRATLVRLGAAEHVLLLVMHHIVTDGWSMGVIVHEIGQLYPAFAAGRPSPLGEPGLQYADYAAWQRGWLQGDVLERQLDYWRGQLAELPVLDLPTDRPRPAVQTFRGARLAFDLAPELSAALESLGEAAGATPFMTLLAALQVLLGRYAGQDDLAVGTVVANRSRAEVEALIGLFLNTLVLRADLSGDPPFVDLLQRVRETCLGAYAHQDLPFEKLVDELQPERDLSRAALFQVMFTLQNLPVPELRLPDGLHLEPLMYDTEAVKFDLTLTMWKDGERFAGVWGYNTDLFERETLERVDRHFRNLLAALAAGPERRLSELALQGADEERRLLVEWNATERNDPRDTVTGLFEARARAVPEATALALGERELSYRELNERANRLARALRDRGIGPERRVAVCTGRSFETVVAWLGVLKAGGAFVPLDPAQPVDRLAYMLRDCGAALILTQEALAGALPVTGAELLLLDRAAADLDRCPPQDPPPACSPDNLAYVIYTSGSTGRPKGVMLEHRGLSNLVARQREAFRVRPSDRVLQFASPSFDASVSEVFVTLVSGAALCLASSEAMLPGASLVELFEREGITAVTLPPSVLAALPAGEYRGLRTLVSAGEACTRELTARWAPGRRFVNAYGPTECTVCATLAEITEAGPRPPIGKPLGNVRVYLLDRRLQPVPVGALGELFVGGAGVARGYLHDPALTAERFLPDPFGAEPGARLYRTGDACRWRPDGNLVFEHRIDGQVKLRGFRIELGEIESVLREHPDVREAAVVARGNRGEAAALAAYVVGREGAVPDADALRRHLAARVPAYMVPTSFLALPELPRLTSGKVDRRALPDPARPRGSAAYTEPRTALERYLAQTWREALGVERVGIHDDFFELGGDSIRGAILINRLQEELGQVIYPVALFDAPNVANLSRFLAENYTLAIRDRFGPESVGGVDRASPGRIEEPQVAELRRAIRSLAPRASRAGGPRNPPAVFLLSPPRSGSTLTRVMLAGHPRLFAPPELLLLNFDTLEERHATLANGRDDFWLEGSVRAVMELRGCDADTAERLVEDARREGLTTREFYGRLQHWLGERLLVDKTPHYALDPEALRRAELDFREPRYIHLVRHPGATAASFEQARLHVVLKPFFLEDPAVAPRRLGELIWLVCHRNITAFLESVPAERRHRLVFEELVSDPRRAMEGVARFLGIDFDPEMLEPHRETKRRMTDPVRPLARMLGDVKFHEHRGIDRTASDRWRREVRPEELGEPTWRLAVELGYEAPESAATIPRASRDARADELLARLDELSPQEVRALLEEMRPAPEGS
jgi:amino acid adenylation domain-containing protein/non-ribosomal peptide synthase protein (TIGR01720 family)